MFNKRMKGVMPVIALLLLSGCATLPEGPSVLVLPAPGKNLTQFQNDDLICRQWARDRVGAYGQDNANRNTATSAVVGTAIGTGVGALLGAASGNAGVGAAFGAGGGLLVGTATGADEERRSGGDAQRRYDYAYVQCMYAKGNQIPGQVHQYRLRRANSPSYDMDNVPSDYDPDFRPMR